MVTIEIKITGTGKTIKEFKVEKTIKGDKGSKLELMHGKLFLGYVDKIEKWVKDAIITEGIGNKTIL